MASNEKFLFYFHLGLQQKFMECTKHGIECEKCYNFEFPQIDEIFMKNVRIFGKYCEFDVKPGNGRTEMV